MIQITQIFLVVTTTLILSGCSGSPIRVGLQSQEDVTEYVRSNPDSICVQYSSALRHFGLDQRESGSKYLKAVFDVAKERSVNPFECQVDYSFTKYGSVKFKAAFMHFQLCRRYQVAPLNAVIKEPVTLKDLSKDPANLVSSNESILENIFTRMQLCHSSYGDANITNPIITYQFAETKKQEIELLTNAYKNGISMRQLQVELEEINSSFNAVFVNELNKNSASLVSAKKKNEIARKEQLDELNAATVKAFNDLSNSLKVRKTIELDCKPDLKSALIGGSDLVCE